MRKRRLKKDVIPYIVGVSSIMVVCLGIIIGTSVSYEPITMDYDYVSKIILDDTLPVVSEPVGLVKPFTDKNVSIITNYYDYTADEDTQQNSLIYSEGIYMQNTGVIYGNGDVFDVISIFDGTVSDVKNDPLLGTIVEITHENNVISVYESLGNTNLKKDDKVLRGQIIGTSGTSNLNPNLGNHLLFELIVNGKTVNPEICYGKTISEL